MVTRTLESRHDRAKELLESVGQAHVLHFYDQLDQGRRDSLLVEIESVDWRELGRLIESHVIGAPKLEPPHDIEPANCYPCRPTPQLEESYTKARRRGGELLAGGHVAVFTVAGGQGTRLGWAGPKGTFPATPVNRTSLFEHLARYIHKAHRKYGATIPWYILTSPANDAATRDFLDRHNQFGLDSQSVICLSQEMMPALDKATGKVLLEDLHSMALAPNGHGGSLKALHRSGALDDMQRRGVEQISYVQIDNPLVKVVDPLFLGLHELKGAEMSSKMIQKTYPDEKLGVFAMVDGTLAVIEYSDLPADLAARCGPDGVLQFGAGSIAVHLIRRDFVDSLNESSGGFGLTFHRAEKKVTHIEIATGRTITPASPNAVKLEMFVFDALPLCETSIVLETDRAEEMAPIKNAEGLDSAASSILMQSERSARWLESRGVTVARKANGQIDALIDISPLTAIDPDDLDGLDLPKSVGAGESFAI